MFAGILGFCSQEKWGVDLLVEVVNLDSLLQSHPQILNMYYFHHGKVQCFVPIPTGFLIMYVVKYMDSAFQFIPELTYFKL